MPVQFDTHARAAARARFAHPAEDHGEPSGVVEALRSSGEGWQGRADAMPREALRP